MAYVPMNSQLDEKWTTQLPRASLWVHLFAQLDSPSTSDWFTMAVG